MPAALQFYMDIIALSIGPFDSVGNVTQRFPVTVVRIKADFTIRPRNFAEVYILFWKHSF